MFASLSEDILFHDGHKIPLIGLGVWQTPPKETAEIVKKAISIGYRAVDTAYFYQNEAGVGAALQEHPDIYITTKLWNESQGYDATLRAFEKSAAFLKKEVIDLYLIHWPMPAQNLYVESWKALIRLKEEGRVRSIGVSNFLEEHLERLIEETSCVPVLNQIELHPYFQQKSLREFHQKHQIRTQAWRPLGKGTILSDPRLTQIAQHHHKSTAQIILRWHVQNQCLIIPKTVHEERMKENLEIFDFALSEEEMMQIAKLDKKEGRMGAHPATACF